MEAFTGNQYVGGNSLKSGAWTSTRFKGGGWALQKRVEEKSCIFEGK